MKVLIKNKAIRAHIIFWILVMLVMTYFFGTSWRSFTNAIFFVSFLLPVIMATSYFFNYFLVPRYLLQRKFFLFALYFIYTLIVSLHLEMIVLYLSFIYLANFNLGEMGLYAKDTVVLGITLYLVVFLGSFILMIKQYQESQKTIRMHQEEKEKLQKGTLELISNRRKVSIAYNNILYIESLADYVQVHTSEGNEIRSKIRISQLQELLPGQFRRIHRSFIINVDFVSSKSYEQVVIKNEIELPVGRSYRNTLKG